MDSPLLNLTRIVASPQRLPEASLGPLLTCAQSGLADTSEPKRTPELVRCVVAPSQPSEQEPELAAASEPKRTLELVCCVVALSQPSEHEPELAAASELNRTPEKGHRAIVPSQSLKQEPELNRILLPTRTLIEILAAPEPCRMSELGCIAIELSRTPAASPGRLNRSPFRADLSPRASLSPSRDASNLESGDTELISLSPDCDASSPGPCRTPLLTGSSRAASPLGKRQAP